MASNGPRKISTPAAAMMKALAQTSTGKPFLKAFELKIHEKYPILSIEKQTTPHVSVIIESGEFRFYLPSAYRNVTCVDLNADEKFSFSIEKLIKLKNGFYTSVLSFYINDILVE